MFLGDEKMFIIIYLIICWLVNLKQKKNYPQRPILAYTIVGAEVLNFCVRDGNRWTTSQKSRIKFFNKINIFL